MGSRAEKKQPGALVGEKSQTVYSANWKLDTMLQKNLQMLDVSKHRVGHRISMDQRVVNKRFQIKLNRSKLTHARMTGNRELLRELIHRDNYTFNTSVGGQDDKYTVKISPTHTLNQQSSEEEGMDKEALKYGNGKGVRPAATSIVVVEPTGNDRLRSSTNAVYKPGTEAVPLGNNNKRPKSTNNRPPSSNNMPTSPNNRPTSSVSIAPRTITRRPATAVTARPRQTLQSNPSTGGVVHGNPENATKTRNEHVDSNQTNSRTRPKTAMPGFSKTSSVAKPARPKTAVARPTDKKGNDHLKAPTPEGQNPSPHSRSNSSTNPQKKRPQSKQKHTMPSIFGEEKRPTLLDLNKERLHRANFPDRVKSFAGTLSGLQTDPDQTVDYYTLRLLENLQCASRKGPREYTESDAERRDADRSIGNLNALNMTFGDVTMELGNHKHNTNPPVRATLRAWESDDDDDKKG
ncbi:uncharacterized protein [Asterias amurensis]|uniref:uncharacterized protein n=1 Tax=Asterias amurensis TaxID=7602 RepID=UPI003AB533B0